MKQPVSNYSKEKYVHLLLKSNLKHPLFVTKSDYQSFMRFLEVKLRQYDAKLLGYCLLPTHLHLILDQDAVMHISAFVHGLTVLYAKYYHRRFDTEGSLFSSGYQKDLLRSNKEFISTLRYIHQKPLQQGYSHSLNYPYGSFGDYMDPTKDSLVHRSTLYRLLDSQDDTKASHLFACIHHDMGSAPIDDVNRDLSRQVLLAKSIMKEALMTYELNYDQIPKDHDFRQQLIMRIHQESTLSQQEIADLLGLSRHIVGRVIRMHRAS